MGITLNSKISQLHERVSRIVYGDRQSTFEELLHKDKSVTIYHINLQILATELCKVSHGLAPHVLNDNFEIRNVRYTISGMIPDL